MGQFSQAKEPLNTPIQNLIHLGITEISPRGTHTEVCNPYPKFRLILL